MLSNHLFSLHSHPPSNKLSGEVKISLFSDKDISIDLNIKAFVGHPSSTQFHVFEASRPLPQFSLYIPCSLSVEPHPQGSVTFQLSERIDRVSIHPANFAASAVLLHHTTRH